jgi:hypothetical protein
MRGVVEGDVNTHIPPRVSRQPPPSTLRVATSSYMGRI